MDCRIIYMNRYIDLIHRAARLCVNGEPLEQENQLKYISKVIGRGHESILEHSNVIMMITLDHDNWTDFIELCPHLHYLNFKVRQSADDAEYDVLIGGSIRGYKHIFRSIENQSNPILNKIKQCIYDNIVKEVFQDFIDAGIFSENEFSNVENDGHFKLVFTKSEVTALNSDNIEIIQEMVNLINPNFTIDDLLDMCTVSILFENISRSASHQLVRHRNAISQESQRYVDYSKRSFIDPMIFKEGEQKTYDIKIKSLELRTDSYELGNTLSVVYNQLIEQGMAKEDARSFLPTNIETKVLMTFTLKNLISFLELRTHPSAQAEIRMHAIFLEDWFATKYKILGKFYKYLIPKYMMSEANFDYESLDEILEEVEQSESLEEYLKNSTDDKN